SMTRLVTATARSGIYTLALHDALPICRPRGAGRSGATVAFEGPVDRGAQAREVVGAVVERPVHEEGRGSGRAAALALLPVGADAAALPVRVGPRVHTEPLPVRGQVGVGERQLVGEQDVVHVPEAALVGRGLRHDG